MKFYLFIVSKKKTKLVIPRMAACKYVMPFPTFVASEKLFLYYLYWLKATLNFMLCKETIAKYELLS